MLGMALWFVYIGRDKSEWMELAEFLVWSWNTSVHWECANCYELFICTLNNDKHIRPLDGELAAQSACRFPRSINQLNSNFTGVYNFPFGFFCYYLHWLDHCIWRWRIGAIKYYHSNKGFHVASDRPDNFHIFPELRTILSVQAESKECISAIYASHIYICNFCCGACGCYSDFHLCAHRR